MKRRPRIGGWEWRVEELKGLRVCESRMGGGVGAGAGIGWQAGDGRLELGVGRSESGRGLPQSGTLALWSCASELRGASGSALGSRCFSAGKMPAALCRRDAGAPRWGAVSGAGISSVSRTGSFVSGNSGLTGGTPVPLSLCLANSSWTRRLQLKAFCNRANSRVKVSRRFRRSVEFLISRKVVMAWPSSKMK